MNIVIHAGLAFGSKIVTIPKFIPQIYLDLLKKHKVNYLSSVGINLLFKFFDKKERTNKKFTVLEYKNVLIN